MRITITKDNFLRLYVLMGSTYLKWRKDPEMRFSSKDSAKSSVLTEATMITQYVLRSTCTIPFL